MKFDVNSNPKLKIMKPSISFPYVNSSPPQNPSSWVPKAYKSGFGPNKVWRPNYKNTPKTK